MKGLVLSDLLAVRGYATQMAIVGIIVGVVIAWGMENVVSMMPCVTTAIAYGLGFTLLSLDEHKGWEAFRATFPFTRSQIVVSRFASLAAIVLFGLVLSCVAAGLMAAASTAVPDAPPFMDEALSGEALAASAALSVAIPLALFAFTVPFAMRLGMTRAVRLMGMVIVLMLLAGYIVATQVGAQIEPAVRFISSMPGGFAAALLVAGVVLYAVASAITCVFYRGREF